MVKAALQEVTVQIARTKESALEVRGFRFEETPGLVITESIDAWDAAWPLEERPWNVTHFLSGQLMAHCLDRAHAERVMAEMARLQVDWLVPPTEVKISRTDLEAIKRIKDESWRLKSEAEEAAYEPPRVGVQIVG